jgi:hypothetical protein
VIRSYIWCAICESRAVTRTGDACPGCMGRIETLIDPITRPPLPGRVPVLLRVLRWLGGQA